MEWSGAFCLWLRHTTTMSVKERESEGERIFILWLLKLFNIWFIIEFFVCWCLKVYNYFHEHFFEVLSVEIIRLYLFLNRKLRFCNVVKLIQICVCWKVIGAVVFPTSTCYTHKSSITGKRHKSGLLQQTIKK